MQTSEDAPNPYRVQSVYDAFSLLEKLVSANEALTASQIAAVLGDSRNRSFRLLKTLEECGYVTLDPTNRSFRPSLKLLTLGQAVSRSQSIELMSRSTMKSLSDEIGETAYLTYREGFESVCIATFESMKMVRIVAQPGTRWPLGRGATGTALLVGAPTHVRDIYLNQNPQMKAVHDRSFQQIVRDGTTLIDGRDGTIADEGVLAMGALIHDTAESANYSLAVAWPHTRSSVDLEVIRKALISAANSIERLFGVDHTLPVGTY